MTPIDTETKDWEPDIDSLMSKLVLPPGEDWTHVCLNDTRILESKDLLPAFHLAEQKSLKKVLWVFMNPRRYTHLRMFSREDLDIECGLNLIERGIKARLWGATIVVRFEIPWEDIYLLDVYGTCQSGVRIHD